MNKKAGQKILSAWWFFVLVIIGGAIVMGVLIYYGSGVNIKELEADVLGERIMRCIVNKGELRGDFSNSFDVFSECNIKKELFNKPCNFYLKISVFDQSDNLEYQIKQGDYSFENDCFTEKLVEAKHYPKCSEKKEILTYKETKRKIVVLAASNQRIKKLQNI